MIDAFKTSILDKIMGDETIESRGNKEILVGLNISLDTFRIFDFG